MKLRRVEKEVEETIVDLENILASFVLFITGC